MMPEPDPKTIAWLVARYEAAAARLKELVLHPEGKTDVAREYNRARNASLLSQVNETIAQLKREAAHWIGPALQSSMSEGMGFARKQIEQAGLSEQGSGGANVRGSFSLVNPHPIEAVARATGGDLYKAADAMGHQAFIALDRLGAAGITNAEANKIVAGGLIEGKPRETVLLIKQAIEKVSGKTVTVPTKSGGSRTFDTGYYASLVGHSKMAEAQRVGQSAQFAQDGIDLVEVTASFRSKYPCTLLMGHVFSLSGTSSKHPAFSSVNRGQEPYRLFHPHCHKYTVPFRETSNSALDRARAAAKIAAEESKAAEAA